MVKAKDNSQRNALDLLKEDHKAVQKMFKDFEKLKEDGDDDEKGELVRKACAELTIHAQIEEEIFYPAARDAVDADDVLDEAEVEHAGAKDLIAQLESMEPGDELYDAKFTVLGEYVNHHIKEEENELFPQVTKAKLDIEAIGVELMQRKLELKQEMGIEESEDSDEDDEDEAATKAGSGRSKTARR